MSIISKLNYNDISPETYLLPDELAGTNSSYIYGEVNHKQIVNELSYMLNDNSGHFLDIGSGCGKIVIAVGSSFPNLYCTGVEIHNERYNDSLELLEKCPELYSNTEFYKKDFNHIYFGTYDIIYCCNIIFSKEDNKQLYKKLLSEFNGYAILFNYDYCMKPYLKKTSYVDTSWQKNVQIFIFKV